MLGYKKKIHIKFSLSLEHIIVNKICEIFLEIIVFMSK